MAADPSIYWDEVLTDQDMGVMYLLFDEALVTRSSGSILFFKLTHDEHEEDDHGRWTLYHTIEDMRGSIYFIRGNIRIQIVTDEKIYFFMIDKKTFIPTLENVMYNFMHCSQMMFGSRVRYGISYKAGQPNFTIYTRKYFHNFKVQISGDNMEGAKGCNLSLTHEYIKAEHQSITIEDDTKFKARQHIHLENYVSKTHQILYLNVSRDQQKFGVCLGIHIIKDHFKITDIMIFKRNGTEFEVEK